MRWRAPSLPSLLPLIRHEFSMHTACHKKSTSWKAKNQIFAFTKWQIPVSVGERILSGTQPQHLGKGSKKWTHCAIDEDPQMFSPNGLQLLPVVQLPEDHFVFQDVVLQDDLEQPLIHGHHFSCKENSVFTPRASQSKDRLTRQQIFVTPVPSDFGWLLRFKSHSKWSLLPI